MIKNGTEKHINNIPGSRSQYKTLNLHFAGLHISLREYYQYDMKSSGRDLVIRLYLRFSENLMCFIF